MGVPSFFAWLLKKYSHNNLLCENILNLKSEIKYLFIDANCLFHPQCFKILNNKDNKDLSNEELEQLMFKEIINYFNYIIDYVKPSELIYIAVDGVAPLAKINQQRKRRYRTINDNIIKNNLSKKYNIISNTKWSNIVITPGTKFMKLLDKYILNNLIFDKKIKPKIIYSNYFESGEGEHKIINYIKQNNISGNIVIYGLDADLIFLSLSCHKNNMFLLRETENFDILNNKYTMTYVNLDNMKILYNTHFIDKIKIINKKNDNINIDFVDDFIVLCFLLGNDFLPHLPSINIKCNGIDLIIDKYINIYLQTGEHIIKDNKLNTKIFLLLFKILGSCEQYYFTKILPAYEHKIQEYKFKEDYNNKDNDYNKELWNLENLKNIKLLENLKNIELLENYKINNDKQLYVDKFKYYEYFFNTIENQQLTINNICYNYLEGLKWTFDYYFNGCNNISWKWQYRYFNAPFISDIANYIEKNNFNFDDIIFNIDKPVKMINQLLAVIPKKQQHILPNKLQKIMTIDYIQHLFPENICIELTGEHQLWHCTSLVPCIDIKLLEKYTDKIQDNIL